MGWKGGRGRCKDADSSRSKSILAMVVVGVAVLLMYGMLEVGKAIDMGVK